MDNIAEQLVEKRRSGADTAKKILISAGALLIASFFMYLAMMGMFTMVIFAVLVLGGGVWLLGNFNVEYEYILTNNEMDIDKIIGRRKRKRMITVDVSKADEFAPYPSDHDVNVDATVHAYTGSETDSYYLIVNHSDYGKVKLIFNPNEKMREAITQELPNMLRVKLRQNGC
ncbi:MAG: hypothetical protein J6A19_01320 [Oscillospiraceae bacterium]|nr:hypothetical protein [Oscillospiraceae bacterium]